MKAYVINAGSVDDIRTSLQHRDLTTKQLRHDLQLEKLKQQSRSSVIQLLVAEIKKKLKALKVEATEGTCVICLCTEHNACPDSDTGTCFWVEKNLCSACATKEQKEKAIRRLMGKDSLGACLQ